MSDAVVIADRAGRVLARNRRFAETLGCTGRAIEGGPCPRDGRCADDPSGARCRVCEIAQTRLSQRALEVVPDASGQQHRWEGTLNPVLDDAGEVKMIVQVWRDVTKRGQLEAQMSNSERLASLGLLAAGIAHEVNNPLASILAGIETLQRWLGRTPLAPADSAEAAEVLGLLEQETGRCREVTDRLLLLGQPFPAKPSWVDLNRVLRDTLSLLAFATRRQKIAVTMELAGELPAIWAREDAMRGVSMNLCMNAVQAMPDGGRLLVRTLALPDDRVQFEVQDTGAGIAPEHLSRIWDPFFTTKPVGQGTGLGLSITQRSVFRHGGSTTVESVPGQGARFIVTLPTHGSGGERV
jgi:PAS domain S-box-containing protein